MNSVNLIGRLTRDPDVRYKDDLAVARFTLAVDRPSKEKTSDFISCVAFGKTAEVIEKYVTKGQKLGVTGKIQTGNYTNKEGQKVYTTDVVLDRMDFFGSNEAEKAEDKQDKPVHPDFEQISANEIPF